MQKRFQVPDLIERSAVLVRWEAGRDSHGTDSYANHKIFKEPTILKSPQISPHSQLLVSITAKFQT